MSEAPIRSGPVSDALERDLRTWVQRHGIVFWLDMAGHYGEFVARLAAARHEGRLPYEVHGFAGSHLELMFALEPHAVGVNKPPLVVHLPGFSEEEVARSPLLELRAAGKRYRKKLGTLVTEAAAGRVRPEQIDAFRAQDGLTLDTADAWLAGLLTDDGGGLASQLRAMSPSAVVDDLLQGGFVAQQLGRPDDLGAVWEYLAASTGLGDAWRQASLPPPPLRADDVAFAVASWALAVEYVDDLRREPTSPLLAPTRGLPPAVVETCCGLARHLRERHAAFYQRVADETETLLAEEADAAKAEDLGDIDTFRFEENSVLDAALGALEAGRWRAASHWAGLRVEGDSFWLGQDPSRRSAWQLIAAAASLGERIASAGDQLRAEGGLHAAVDRYRTDGAAVDRAHRQLEQRRLVLLLPRLPQFERLRAALDTMRRHWREWADAWALDFAKLCSAHGFVPDSSLQQRTLFDEVVRPLTQETGVTAYFVVDALRYEMAEELYCALADTPASTVRLEARLAELPSVTEVGMNALAPVAKAGKLSPARSGGKLLGFSTGEFRVDNPKTRQRAMHDRVGGGTCPWLTLEEVLGRDGTALVNTVKRAKLVVVHSLEIDEAGEKGAGPAVFELALQKLRAAWSLLRDAGVRRFVITADHGFLLLDDQSGGVQSHGRKIDPKRRHVLSDVAADHTGEVRVPLADLGYEGVEGHLMFPETTAVFDTGKRSMSFVHGGNSLQERVIPVLTLVHRSASGGNTLSYAVEAVARQGQAGMHALAGSVRVAAQAALDFGGRREVELALTAIDAPGVQVELCQTRGGARLAGGAVQVTVDREFELLFRLTGQTDARVRVELAHPAAVVDVAPFVLAERFEVTALGSARAPDEVVVEAEAVPAGANWLGELPEGGIRQLFSHLASYGAVTEAEAVNMLGSPRALRKFARGFEGFAAKAPFSVRIDVVSGVKRYVREGAGS